MILLDTHAWFWWLTSSEKISPKARHAIEEAEENDGLGVSVMSCWELAMLAAKKRLMFSVDVGKWIDDSLKIPSLRLVDLTPEISVLSTRLPGRPHGDPVDRILMATAIHLKMPLVSRDRKIGQYKLVETIW